MGAYSSEYYNENFMVGFTNKRGKAWHNREGFTMVDGFDNNYPDAIPAEDIERRLFNWSPIEAPLFVETSMGMMPVDGRKAITRGEGGAVLGIHSDGYLIHDFRQDLIHNLDAVVGANGLGYANAGLLKHGAQAYVQIELPENVKTSSGGVEIRPFILGSTSLDGSIATDFKMGFTNVVCDNTLAMFQSEGGKVYRRRHTKNSAFDLTTARQALDLLDTAATSAVASIEHFLNIEVSDNMWAKFVEAHVPIEAGAKGRGVTMAENKREDLTSLWNTDERVAPWAGSAWGVMQAVNTYNEHLAIVRKSDRYERKMTNAISGKTAESDKAAMELLGKVMDRDLALV